MLFRKGAFADRTENLRLVRTDIVLRHGLCCCEGVMLLVTLSIILVGMTGLVLVSSAGTAVMDANKVGKWERPTNGEGMAGKGRAPKK